MKTTNSVSLLIILFLLDVLKPFSFNLNVEFLFVGIIIISFYLSTFYAVFLAIILGTLVDLLLEERFFFHVVFFLITVGIIKYFMRYFHWRKVFIFIVPLFAIILYAFLNTLVVGDFSYFFILNFSLETFIFFLGVEYLVRYKFGPFRYE